MAYKNDEWWLDDRDGGHRHWIHLDPAPAEALPNVPPLDCFASRHDLFDKHRYNDCDEFLWWGPYAVFHVAEWDGTEPYPRTLTTPFGHEPDGTSKACEPIHSRPREAGWYAEAAFRLEFDDGYQHSVGNDYLAARACDSAEEAFEKLKEAAGILRQCGPLLDLAHKGMRGTPGWRLTISVLDEDTGDPLRTREVGPWGFYRFAMLASAPLEMLFTLLKPRECSCVLEFDMWLDMFFAGYDSGDNDVCDMCETEYEKGDDIRLAMQVART